MEIDITTDAPENKAVLKELYAWIAVDDDGTKSATLLDRDDKDTMALIDGNRKLLESYTEYAQATANKSNHQMHLMAFKYIETFVVLEPQCL